MKKIIKNPRFIVPIFLALGILYRAILIYCYPQPFINDQIAYHDMAMGILTHGIFAAPFYPYGYPMIIAILFKLFGTDNTLVWTLTQICMDAGVAVFIYWTAKDLFGKTGPALVAFFLYIVSPFVAAYTGMMLTEVSAVFGMAIFFMVWHRFFFTSKVRFLILAAFLMGFVPEIRPSFIFFMVGIFGVTLYLIRNKGIKWMGWVAVVVAYLIPISYALIGNYTYFHKISLLNVNSQFAGALVVSQLYEGRVIHADRPHVFPERMGEIITLENQVPYNAELVNRLDKEELQEGIQMVKRDPIHFIVVRFQKAFYIWEKYYIIYYSGDLTPVETAITYGTNALLIVSAIAGMILLGISHMKWHQRLFLFMSIGLILSTSIVHMLTVAETRYSLPAYPILFIFSGYCITEFWNKYRTWRIRRFYGFAYPTKVSKAP